MKTVFEHYIRTDEMHMKYAKGAPSAVGKEFHDYSELVLFLDGKARLISKNIQQTLVPGTLVIIPKGEFHQFVVTEPESYLRCIIGFRETEDLLPLLSEVFNGVRVLTSLNPRILSLFEELMDITTSTLSDYEKQLYLHAALVRLLILCKQSFKNVVIQNINISPEVRDTIEYIDLHFAEPLTVYGLSQRVHVSPSTLSHKFSKELNISVYRYLSKKRLAAAHDRIQKGEALTDAAIASGFGDYSCFFRMYRKYYESDR